MDSVSGKSPFNLIPLWPIFLCVWFSLFYQARSILWKMSRRLPLLVPQGNFSLCSRAFARPGHYSLSSPAFCPSPSHKREPSSKLQFPLLGSLFFSYFSHFYDFSCNLCDDSSRIRLWFGILCPYLHEFVRSLHTVTLGIPSKFIVSTLAQSLSHLPLFSVYTAWAGNLVSSCCFFLTY